MKKQQKFEKSIWFLHDFFVYKTDLWSPLLRANTALPALQIVNSKGGGEVRFTRQNKRKEKEKRKNGQWGLVRNKDKKTIIRKTKKMKNKTRPMAFNRRPREHFLCNKKNI